MEIIDSNIDNYCIDNSNHIDNTIEKEDNDISLMNDTDNNNNNTDIYIKSRKTISIESTDNSTLFPALDNFASIYNKYPHCIVTLYQILRDLYIKQEVVAVRVIDGMTWNRNEYFIQAKSVETQIVRILVPCHLDSEIDLQWIQNIVVESAKDNKELYLCVHTPESIIYEQVTADLP